MEIKTISLYTNKIPIAPKKFPTVQNGSIKHNVVVVAHAASVTRGRQCSRWLQSLV